MVEAHRSRFHAIKPDRHRPRTPLEKRHIKLEYVAVQFMNMDKDLERVLGWEIMEIQRVAICKVIILFLTEILPNPMDRQDVRLR